MKSRGYGYSCVGFCANKLLCRHRVGTKADESRRPCRSFRTMDRSRSCSARARHGFECQPDAPRTGNGAPGTAITNAPAIIRSSYSTSSVIWNTLSLRRREDREPRAQMAEVAEPASERPVLSAFFAWLRFKLSSQTDFQASSSRAPADGTRLASTFVGAGGGAIHTKPPATNGKERFTRDVPATRIWATYRM
jgi:hypothetical protein